MNNKLINKLGWKNCLKIYLGKELLKVKEEETETIKEYGEDGIFYLKYLEGKKDTLKALESKINIWEKTMGKEK